MNVIKNIVTTNQSRTGIALLMFCGVSVGCGSNSDQVETAPVSGAIIYKNNAVTTGTIMFTPKGGGPPSTGEIQSDGSFRMKTYTEGDGSPLGEHSVTITALDAGSGLPEDAASEPRYLVPPKYGRDKTSGLTAVVEAGYNQIDFRLKE